MKLRLFLLTLISLFFVDSVFSQGTLKGTVMEITEKGDTSVLPGATLYWLHTTLGTQTDNNGKYSLAKIASGNKLIISYIGFENDTATIDTSQARADFLLSNTKTLKEVVVVYQGRSSEFSFMNPVKVETLGQRELAKAACCNLSESFETNPSVDVNFADAVTGTKQIQMLGLSGQYALITKENMPYLRGLASMYGLSFIPGTWIQSIQLSKGAGSVINGYESFTGQINTQLQEPSASEKLFFNAYVNANGRNEYNLNSAHKLTDVWSTVLLLHASFNPIKQDFNGDGFLDIPTGKQYNVANKWQYRTVRGFEGQFGGSYIIDNRTGGQIAFNAPADRNSDSIYGIGINTERYELFAKNGYVFRNRPETSMGLQMSFTQHRQDNFYGVDNYKGQQQTFYANYIFQGILGNTNHKYKAGASYMNDAVSEKYKLFNYSRAESVPGAFVEYAYSYLTNFNMVAGLRADQHNYYGLFFTPRLHLRYAFNNSNTVIRASGGRALKTANIFAENSAFMASSRSFEVLVSDSTKPYGLKPEIAWNYGLNFLHKFKLNYREAQIVLDLYRTDFTSQVVVDVDADPHKVFIYNLQGRSFSNTVQTEFSWEIRKRLQVRTAYRYIDTRTQYATGLLPRYLLSKHRAFINLSYETKDQHWLFDLTTQWHGPKRLPNTQTNPLEYQRSNLSPAFFIVNSQVTFKTGFKRSFDIYLGVENALNVKMPNPILASNNPFGPYFDASMVWGPIYGRMIYGGVRFKIK